MVSCIKGYKIKEQHTDEIREFIKQITGIANNINQIARVSNGTKYVQDKDLEYVKNSTINNKYGWSISEETSQSSESRGRHFMITVVRRRLL